MSSKYTKRLGQEKDYNRPLITPQQQLTKEDIAQKLRGYKNVKNIVDVPIDTHIRYIRVNPNTGEQEFRTGGFLHRKDNADKYVILSNGSLTWTVQVANTIFFRKMSHEEEITEIEEYYKNEIKILKKEIKKLKKIINN
jgi:hypothetical protein